MDYVGPPSGNVSVYCIDVIGLDCNLWPILRRILGTFDDVGFCSVPAHDGQRAVLVEYLKAEAIDEKIKSFVHSIEEHLRNKSNHHEVCIFSNVTDKRRRQLAPGVAPRPKCQLSSLAVKAGSALFL